jgi:hypothetical protein
MELLLKMKKNNFFCLIFLLSTCSLPSLAIDIDGSADFFAISYKQKNSPNKLAALSTHTIAINSHLSKYTYFAASYELLLSSFNLTDYTKASQNYRLFSLKDYNSDNYNFTVKQNLNRLYLKQELGPLSLSLGRDGFNFSNTNFISSINIFAINLVSLGTEEIPGLDGIKLYYDISATSQFKLSYIFSEKKELKKNILAAEFSYTLEASDINLALLLFDNNILIATGLSGEIQTLQSYLETSLTFGKDDKVYLRSTLGLGKLWNTDWMSMVEYHYNGFGSSRYKEYEDLTQTYYYQNSYVSMLARHYISLSQTITLSHISQYSVSATANLSDSSLVLTNSFTHSLDDNLEIKSSLFIPVVLNKKTRASLSEFGKTPLLGAIGIKFYW